MRTGGDLLQAVTDGTMQFNLVPQARLASPDFRLAVGQVILLSAPRTGMLQLEDRIGLQLARQVCPDDSQRRGRQIFDDTVMAARLSTSLLVPERTQGITSTQGPNLAIVLPGSLHVAGSPEEGNSIERAELSVLFSLLTNRRTTRGGTNGTLRPTRRVDYVGDRVKQPRQRGLTKSWVTRRIRPAEEAAIAFRNHRADASERELARLALVRHFGSREEMEFLGLWSNKKARKWCGLFDQIV